MLDEFIKHILGEWRMISQAPVSFITAVLVAGICVWLAMQWGYGREISLLRQQESDYKDRLSGATPDQAKARIDDLEARLKQIEPRQVTPKQQRAIVAAAHTLPNQYALAVNFEGGCPDCPQYSAGLVSAFRDAGWAVTNPMVMGPTWRPRSGVGLSVLDPANLGPEATLVRNALQAAHIEFEIRQGPPFRQPFGPSLPLRVEIQITASVR
jgi:hypothetical protein